MTGGRSDERVPEAEAADHAADEASRRRDDGPAGEPDAHGAELDVGGAAAAEAPVVEEGEEEEAVASDEAPADEAPADEAAADEAPADELTELRRERDEYLDIVRRVQADFENYKKRMIRQQTELLERAAEGLVNRLLPVLDAFDLARAHLEAEASPEGKALLQAAGLLEETMAKEGLERVDAVGVAFDPTVHEAVEHEPADPGAQPESSAHAQVVTGVLRAGYRYKGRVVRPAMVQVRG